MSVASGLLKDNLFPGHRYFRSSLFNTKHFAGWLASPVMRGTQANKFIKAEVKPDVDGNGLAGSVQGQAAPATPPAVSQSSSGNNGDKELRSTSKFVKGDEKEHDGDAEPRTDKPPKKTPRPRRSLPKASQKKAVTVSSGGVINDPRPSSSRARRVADRVDVGDTRAPKHKANVRDFKKKMEGPAPKAKEPSSAKESSGKVRRKLRSVPNTPTEARRKLNFGDKDPKPDENDEDDASSQGSESKSSPSAEQCRSVANDPNPRSPAKNLALVVLNEDTGKPTGVAMTKAEIVEEYGEFQGESLSKIVEYVKKGQLKGIAIPVSRSVAKKIAKLLDEGDKAEALRLIKAYQAKE